MLRSITLIAAALLLAGPAAARAQDPYPSGARPHSTLSIRDLDGVAVTRLQASTVRRGAAIVARIRLTARTRDGRRRVAVIRAGRCLPGGGSYLACPPSANRRVTLRGRPVTFRLIARVPVPRRSADAIRISLTRPGEVPRPYHPGAHAQLELQGEGWRGRLAGRLFGAVIHPVAGIDVDDLRMDAVGIRDGAVRPTIRWSARTSRAATVEWACTVEDCGGSVPVTPGGRANGDFTRPFLETPSRAVGIRATIENTRLFEVDLPTPRR